MDQVHSFNFVLQKKPELRPTSYLNYWFPFTNWFWFPVSPMCYALILHVFLFLFLFFFDVIFIITRAVFRVELRLVGFESTVYFYRHRRMGNLEKRAPHEVGLMKLLRRLIFWTRSWYESMTKTHSSSIWTWNFDPFESRIIENILLYNFNTLYVLFLCEESDPIKETRFFKKILSQITFTVITRKMFFVNCENLIRWSL